MTVSEIIEIIGACERSGVRTFAFSGLKLEFQQKQAGEPLAVEDPKIAQSNIEENEIRIKMEQLEELKLREPLLYEQIVSLETEL